MTKTLLSILSALGLLLAASLLIPFSAISRESIRLLGADQGGTGLTTITDGGVMLGSGTAAVTPMAVLTSGQLIIGDGTTDPAAAVLSGDVTMAASGAVTIAATSVEAGMIAANAVTPAKVSTLKGWKHWAPTEISASDGTQCVDSVQESTIAGPEMNVIVCLDSDTGLFGASTFMPTDWDAGTVVFRFMTVQTGAETLILHTDIEVQCRGAGEAIVDTWSAEVAMDDAAQTGTSGVDVVTSAAITPNGTCAAGDLLIWQISIDAGGTTATMATNNFVGVDMEYAINPS